MFLTCITKCLSLCILDGSILSFVAIDATGELHKTLDEQDDESILSIVWNSKGDLLLVLRCDSTVKIWDTRTWKPKQELISRSGETWFSSYR